MSIVDWFAKKRAEQQAVEREKLDIPGDLWIKCFKCGEVLFNKSLEDNSKVCPSCNHHFRLTCMERLAITVDDNSFKEFNRDIKPTDFLKFKDSKKYEERIELARKRSGINDAIISGVAKINKKEVIICIMDFSFMGGSMGSVVGEKIARAAEEAIKRKVALIIMSSSGGARMQEGIMSLMQMAKTSAALKKLAEHNLMYISVLLDPTTGGTTASFAMLGDLNVSEPGALIGFAGPRVIEQTIRQKLPKGFQRAEYLQDHGMIDMVVHRKDMKETLGLLVGYGK